MRFRKRQRSNQGEIAIRMLRYKVIEVMDHYGEMGEPVVKATVALALAHWRENNEFEIG